ncbi:hypothetical protein TRE132_01900 [Pseudomonas chlororaphis subsp. aurantiaca]|nr:hypothetical protein TRE132_01900 [Pseudomonas chlororaphis subsp. aurantiaca]
MRSGRREARKPCSRCRAREAAIGLGGIPTQQPQNLNPRSTWKNASSGLATATQSIAGCASGYRNRGACVAAAEPARLRSVVQQPQNLNPRSTWKNASPGLATATQSIAGCASGYRNRGACVAAAEPARLRSVVQQPQNLNPRSTWKNASPGLATATQSIAGCASGYRNRGACVAAAEPARLRSVVQQPQNLNPRSTWKNASPGLATATQSIAGCASGYRVCFTFAHSLLFTWKGWAARPGRC